MSAINLLRGWPAPALLPAAHLSDAALRVLLDPHVAVPSLQYGPDPGYQPLREELARYLSTVFAAHDAPSDQNRICVTGGASQNMACVLQSFTDPAYTAVIWVSTPCYYLMCPIFEDAGFAGRLRAVPEDDQGINVAALETALQAWEKKAQKDEPVHSRLPPLKPNLGPHRKAYRHLIYVVPTSSNPSGRTMPLDRREALVRLARTHDALVVADDVYDLLQWPVSESSGDNVALPPSLPRLVDVDRMLPHDTDTEDGVRFGYAISNGSFSKLAGPGLRTGWVEGTPAFVYGLSQTGSTRSGGAPSQLCASMLAYLLASGTLDRHLQHVVRPALQRRRRLIVDALVAQRLEDVVEIVSEPQTTTIGGYFVWLRLLRPDMRATEVAARAQRAEQLMVAPGTMFGVKGDEAAVPLDSFLRLSFSWEDEARLAEGVERLARVLRSWDATEANVTEARDGTDGGPEEYK